MNTAAIPGQGGDPGAVGEAAGDLIRLAGAAHAQLQGESVGGIEAEGLGGLALEIKHAAEGQAAGAEPQAAGIGPARRYSDGEGPSAVGADGVVFVEEAVVGALHREVRVGDKVGLKGGIGGQDKPQAWRGRGDASRPPGE